MKIDWNVWEARFIEFLRAQWGSGDAAHDLEHVRRVVANATHLAEAEGADPGVVVPAAWLHDCVIISKDSPDRPLASRLAAAAAGEFLTGAGYPAHYIPAIVHAIEAHSFSVGIAPETPEAKVVQDADRLDALGAVGIARCIAVGAVLGRALYDPSEPFPKQRPPDDRLNTIDHFYTKLFRLAENMHTTTGREEARQRTAFMQAYLSQLGREILMETA